MFICAGILSVIAVLVITLSSPLFAVLGFEYSTLMALALSLVCGIAVITRQRTEVSQWTEIRLVTVKSLLLASAPLVISIISLLFIANCSFSDGLIFYLEIAYPSAIFGGLFGLAISWLVKKRSKAILFFIVFWIITLFLSFLPGYFNPQLYTYGWQYGFFPGIVWDESLELTNAYLAFRIENIIWIIFALSLTYEMRLPRVPKMWFVIPGVIALTLFGFQDELHITTSHDAVNSSLTKILQPIPNCSIYYAPGSLTQDELDKINRDVRWYLHDIEMRFFLHPPSEPISIYIYPSSDAMFSLIGTRTASISKPWLGELHIAKENLESLKHELTHVLLRQKGVFPFYVSWSTGLTEGAAMSVEPEYDGIYTLDEHAARILQMHYAKGVKEVMSFTGFASNASQKSYVLAGSFSRYLLKTYGPLPFNSVYASLDWQKEYGKPLDTLEAEWKRWLAPMMMPMNADDSEHFRYYYDRASIIFNPCLRRIGKLNLKGQEASRRRDFNKAEYYYSASANESGGTTALQGLSDALYQQDSIASALLVLDTPKMLNAIKGKSALLIRKGDLAFMLGDTAKAFEEYDRAMQLKLSASAFLMAYVHHVLGISNMSNYFREYLKLSYKRVSNRKQVLDSIIILMDSTRDPLFQQLYQYHRDLQSTDQLRAYMKSRWNGTASSFDRAGQVLRYLHILTGDVKVEWDYQGFVENLKFTNDLTESDSLAFYLMCTNLERRSSPLAARLTDVWCPAKFSHARDELRKEMDEEWDYTWRSSAPNYQENR